MMLKHFLTVVTFSLATLAWVPANAQQSLVPNTLAQTDVDFSGGLFPQFSMSGFADQPAEPATWSASYVAKDGTTEGELQIEVALGLGWHVYSMTQPPGGPLPTKLAVVSPANVKPTASFKPDREPTRSVSAEFKGVTVEEYENQVTWTAPLSLPADYRGPITVEVNGLVCKKDGSCLPVSETLVAKLQSSPADQATPLTEALPAEAMPTESAFTGPSLASEPFRDDDYVVEWTAKLSPSIVAPGGLAMLTFTATPDATFHIYPAAVDDANFATNFAITQKSGLKIGEPKSDSAIASMTLAPSMPPIEYHKGKVTWTLPIQVPLAAELGDHAIEGFIAYQACDDKSCLQPQAIRIATTLTVSASPAGSTPPASTFVIESTKAGNAKDAAAETKWVDVIGPEATPMAATPLAATAGATADSVSVKPMTAPKVQQPQSLSEASVSSLPAPTPTPPVSFPLVLLMAFAGGVILNVMPCVLPVVGLKVMSFVKQAGEDRGRVLRLNYVYVLGILSVFALLAVLAVVASLSWGEQFTYFPVRLGLTLALFALALSYFGVWEIPVPGMASGKASQQLQSREGYLGAFSKGVFTTILATPCSGPLLGYILGLTFALSPFQTIVVIMSVGFGMSLPYIIIGIKPSLVSWLPKPGPWMETLKQFLAFLFLGTVAFFFAGFRDEQRVPVFVTLIGVWFGCWVIGLVPNWESLNKRLTSWVTGIAAATAIGFAAFNMLGPGELKWEPYSEARLQQLQAEGRTVMLDFTAGWCSNCIVNTHRAIDTIPTREMVEELNAVPMLADWTDPNDEIKAKLTELQSRSIPLLAIYPGSAPGQPIVLRDLVSQSDVLTALEKAGPSVGSSSSTRITPVSHSSTQVSAEPALR